MRRLKYILLALLIWGCNEYKDTYDCEDCLTSEPQIATLEIAFTREFNKPNPVIYIYLGFFEQQTIIDTIYTDSLNPYISTLNYTVDINHFYTVAARYIRSDDTIWAIDGNFVSKEKYYNYDCDTTCWQIKGTKLNVKLKNF